MSTGSSPDPRRVERLFGSEFGVAYTDRNAEVDARKPQFFHDLFAKHGISRLLECGSNRGLNLGLCAADPAMEVWGVDIQRAALSLAAQAMPKGNFVYGSLFDLPFKDNWFDIAFTCGVLIHVPPEGLGAAMDEMYRVSRGWILCAEYHDEREVEVPYRGLSGALWRRNYGAMWQERFPGLTLVDQGYKAPEEGFDRITWQLLRKP